MNNNKQNENNNAKHQFSNTEPLTHAQRVAIANKMSNDKQSSIELFIEQLEEKGKAYEETIGVRTVNICIDVSEYMELKQQAKEMHKEEITDALIDGSMNSTLIEYRIPQYYNETFGGNNEQL